MYDIFYSDNCADFLFGCSFGLDQSRLATALAVHNKFFNLTIAAIAEKQFVTRAARGSASRSLRSHTVFLGRLQNECR